MSEKDLKYQFVITEEGRRLICPGCSSLVTSTDVEMFPACPYCGKVFEQTAEFEDFAIENLSRRWQRSCFGFGPGQQI